MIAALALVMASASWAVDAPPHADDSAAQRVVAVGDVHGSLDGLVEILAAAGLIDGNRRWAGGAATLVQTGDLLDRGADVREVMDLLIRLQEESRAAGGQVICLLGNHDAMDLLGILRDVNRKAYEDFRSPRSEARQASAWKQQIRVWERRTARAGLVMVDIPEETRTKWLETFPPGSFEYVDALGPEGRYGRWLRSCPVAVVIGGTLFVHGGLSPAFGGVGIAELNRRAAAELASFEAGRNAEAERGLAPPWASIEEVGLEAEQELTKLATELNDRERKRPKTAAYLRALEAVRGWRSWVLMAEDGPLWTRGPAEWDESEHGGEMKELIAGTGAVRMVVGHTVQKSASIQARFGSRVFLIDTGMLKSAYGGRPSALEICGAAVTAIYPNSRQELVGGEASAGLPATSAGDPPSEAAPQEPRYRWLDVEGAPLPFQDDAAIESFLATADVIAQQDIPVGVTRPIKVVLERDGVRAHAAFKYVDERRKFVSLKVAGRERVFPAIRDYHLFDCAAYHLDRLLGLGRFPPSVPRRIGDRDGTLKLWLEDTIMEKDRRDRDLRPPDPDRMAQQRDIMLVFDAIAGNTDSTNVGNALIDRFWNLWFIDCSRCFVTDPKPLDLDSVTRCDRTLWKRLNELTDEEIRTALTPFLGRGELNALIRRKAAVVDRLAGLIGKSGEAAVIFDLNPPQPEPAGW